MINSAAGSLDAEELAEKTLKKGYPDGEGGALSNLPGSTGCEKIGNRGDR